jgi:hypothetical protein
MLTGHTSQLFHQNQIALFVVYSIFLDCISVEYTERAHPLASPQVSDFIFSFNSIEIVYQTPQKAVVAVLPVSQHRPEDWLFSL